MRELRVALATVVIFLIFDRVAAWLGSTRGEAGVVVCAMVLALTFGAQRALGGTPLVAIPRVSASGLRPAPRVPSASCLR